MSKEIERLEEEKQAVLLELKKVKDEFDFKMITNDELRKQQRIYRARVREIIKQIEVEKKKERIREKLKDLKMDLAYGNIGDHIYYPRRDALEDRLDELEGRVTEIKPESPYAGFWYRFAASFLDGLIIFGVFFIPWFYINYILPTTEAGRDAVTYLTILIIYQLVYATAVWLYSALMESSKWQATPGKRAMGIKVTDLNGNRISFLRATGRHFAKYISALTFYIGFIMIAFTEKKQGLHDMMAGCLVVKTKKTKRRHGYRYDERGDRKRKLIYIDCPECGYEVYLTDERRCPECHAVFAKKIRK
jgi:uncharacterized RDD family membrane protein YckC